MTYRPSVAITRCSTYSEADLDKSMKEICEAASMPDVAGKKVLLKPNILSDSAPE